MITKIYIPTRGRVGLHKQATLREFLSKSKHVPYLVCPRDEAAEHAKYHSKVLVRPEGRIAPTRQWILENTFADVIILADDDLSFAYRPNAVSIKLQPCEYLNPLVELIEECVNRGYVHGGVGARQGNNHKRADGKRSVIEDGYLLTDCDRVTNFHYLHRRKVLELGVRLDALPVMEDFHFTLSMLTRGYPNRVIHSYVWNQAGSGKQGGCSLWRTPEVQEQAANDLAKAFPKFVTVVTKTSKSVWKGMQERKDVRIQWQKAYQSSCMRDKCR